MSIIFIIESNRHHIFIIAGERTFEQGREAEEDEDVALPDPLVAEKIGPGQPNHFPPSVARTGFHGGYWFRIVSTRGLSARVLCPRLKLTDDVKSTPRASAQLTATFVTYS